MTKLVVTAVVALLVGTAAARKRTIPVRGLSA
jgi:hypothetical protein